MRIAAGILLGLLLAGVASATPAPYRLLAHRGGVVEDKLPDNSPAALEAAVARGYWGLEVDIRESKDGVLLMQHDPDLKLNFGDPRKIVESTWDDLSKLRTKSGQRLQTFDELVAAAKKHGLYLMLDPKDPHSADFPGKVEAVLAKHDMLAHACCIGTADVMTRLTGKAPVGKKFRSLKPLLEADPSAKEKYFLFEEGRTLTEEMIKWAQARSVRIIPSVNVYHYYDAATMSGKSREELAPIILAAAKRHIEAFKALGVTEFQIDSEFDRWFGEPSS